MRRREIISGLGSVAAAWPLSTLAQPQKTWRIGLLANDPNIPQQATGKAFIDELGKAGFVEGKNLVIERRFASGRVAGSDELALELVQLNVDVLVSSGSQNHSAAKKATATIPIVMVNAPDPVGQGLVASLARPGGNITGVVQMPVVELASKRLQLLRDMLPSSQKVTVLINSDATFDRLQWDVLEPAAKNMHLTLMAAPIREGSELGDALSKLNDDRPDALTATNNGLFLTYRRAIADAALKSHIPYMSPFSEGTRDGALMSYGTSRPEEFRLAARYVAKILNGAKPADMPIEQPTKFELVINHKTAKALGLTIPETLTTLADEVIE